MRNSQIQVAGNPKETNTSELAVTTDKDTGIKKTSIKDPLCGILCTCNKGKIS